MTQATDAKTSTTHQTAPRPPAGGYMVMDRQGRIHHFAHFPSQQHVMQIEMSNAPQGSVDRSFSDLARRSLSARPVTTPPTRVKPATFIVDGILLITLAVAAQLAHRAYQRRGAAA